MKRDMAHIESTDTVLATLRSSLRRSAQRGRVVLIRGSAGMGKTRLLDAAAKRWRSDGVRTVHARISARSAQPGLDETLDALRHEFDRSGGSELIDGISAVARSRARARAKEQLSPDEADPQSRFATTAAELGRVFARIGQAGPTAVLFDDVLEAEDPALLLVTACRPGCLVVASLRDDAVPSPVAAELVSLADDVVTLAPMSEAEIASIVGVDLDERTHQALRVALGPLYGNPGTVLDTLAALRRQGRLVCVDGRLRVKDPGAIALPHDHDILRRIRRHGKIGPRLLGAAAAFDGLDVDELPLIAGVLGVDVAECGRGVDRLVEAGALVEGVRGDLVCLCPALATSIAQEEAATVRRLLSTLTPAPADDGRRAGAPVALPGSTRQRPGLPARISRAALSAVEARIVDLIGLGFTNRRIASEIGLSEKTVERYLTRLYVRTGCRSRVELVAAGLSGRAAADDTWGPAA
ncbi:hypothetical protein GCM10011581_45250 [Saccharopolyspora subtropica]|uniref:HTH luxR-type domain-containing protein n=1 Tax=Saccharopolyspora thermophila TaxID=89367 RepID=A0A917K9B6_9PSEU|nr:LuxR family transcriptional regulator [Saccharopolyspora subtropica]GGJ03078.1 hypothetical protein GCM10011581_45250 [Saccharopolyspora subtropica]